VLARLHFIIYATPGETPEYDEDEIEARLVETVRSWKDNLYDALIDSCGEERGTELFRKYRDAFSPGYRAGFLARTAVSDIQRMEALGSEDDIEMSLYHPLEEPEDFLGFKLFRLGEQVSLSDILPLLEDMGVEVVDERPHEVKPAGSPPAWIYDFGLVHGGRGELQTGEVKGIFQDAFARAWRGTVENDGFNRLVLLARMTWREIMILRAYCKYLRQTGTTFSQDYMEDTLVVNPHIARLLVDLFMARLDPSSQSEAEAESERLEAEISSALDAVVSLDEDRIMRSFLDVTLATLRTNYFQSTLEGGPKPHLSFKLDPEKIPGLPLPLPRFEIFVYSPRTEGVHLRGGEVARGGIRWSDRREDFRTEILGLMKAQTVKNAVIVPVGAKGGFVVKRPPAEGGREAMQQEVVACYKTLIRGMLDITDNISGDEIVPPQDVTRYDDDDPYPRRRRGQGNRDLLGHSQRHLHRVRLLARRRLRLGRFRRLRPQRNGHHGAGRLGVGHRHFREMGKDIQNEDFTVVGVGDMSGDVFGNGMLLSRHIKLLGAFNHLHIFLDPDPNPEASFEERMRLFGLPRSSWTDYDKGLISEGGGVFERTAKSIPLSPEVRELLGVEARPDAQRVDARHAQGGGGAAVERRASAPTSRPARRATPRSGTGRTTH
jgi:glutamate dehydrogenase